MRKYSNVFQFLRIYKRIFEYIWLSKNLRMNIQIYSYWGIGTNTNTNNIWGPFYSNIQIFEYSNIRAHHCPNWKSILYNLTKGTMKFLFNSFINTLPTQDNLKLWSKTFSDKCHLCKNKDTTLHCLNGCKIALCQGRFIWIHDNITYITYIVNSVDKSKFTLFSDISRHQTSNGDTIPPNMTFTPLKPERVIIDKKKSYDIWADSPIWK